jgi:ketosteroid isomerase-like protein
LHPQAWYTLDATLRAADTRRAMSQEKVEMVRKPLRIRERSSRTLDQRFALRFPGLAEASGRLIGRLPPTSRLRQAAAERWVRLGFEAFNRRDFEAILTLYHPRFELCAARELVDSGIADPSYRGHAAYVAFTSGWLDAWGAFHLEPHEMIDLGHRVVVLGTLSGRGGKSGAPVDQSVGIVYDQENARVIENASTSTMPRPSKPGGCASRRAFHAPQLVGAVRSRRRLISQIEKSNGEGVLGSVGDEVGAHCWPVLRAPIRSRSTWLTNSVARDISTLTL